MDDLFTTLQSSKHFGTFPIAFEIPFQGWKIDVAFLRDEFPLVLIVPFFICPPFDVNFYVYCQFLCVPLSAFKNVCVSLQVYFVHFVQCMFCQFLSVLLSTNINVLFLCKHILILLCLFIVNFYVCLCLLIFVYFCHLLCMFVYCIVYFCLFLC